MLLTSSLSRRWLSSFWGRSKTKLEDVSGTASIAPSDNLSAGTSEMNRSRNTGIYEGSDVETLLSSLKKSLKLHNAHVYEPPANVEEVIEKVVLNALSGSIAKFNSKDDWRSLPLNDTRLKYKVLSELISELKCDVPNFLLADMKSVADVIAHFKSPNFAATTASARLNPIEQMGILQQRGELPPNIHVQVEYPGRVVASLGADSLESGEDDPRSKIYTGVDNVVTSIKYRRKYRGFTAKIKEPLV